MKVYFVMPAPIGQDDIFVMMYGETLPVEAFFQRCDAEDFAKRKAAENRGEQFWIVEGDPMTSFASDPVPVFERKPEIRAI
ncbi:hypothetical protein WKW50_07275 [Ochrobactrum sp. GPK 3]